MSTRPLTDAVPVTEFDQPTPPPQPVGPGVLGALVGHLQDPMRRSSYALILGTGLTSVLGLVFWIIAARWLPDSIVGLGAALVSAVTLLANFSTLGMRNGLVRFLPAAGPAARRLIGASYLLCAGTAVVLATAFLIGQPVWAQKLGFLRHDLLSEIVFVSAVVVWVIFILQDNVLLAQRRATWVPIANGICSVAKIALLPVLAFGAVWAIFAASVLPAAAAVVLITVLVLRRPRTAPVASEPLSLTRLARFAATDHLSALLWLGTADILTLVILQRIGPEASAYYFIATTIGYSMYLITSNIGSALVAEGARYPTRSVALARQATLNAARLVIPLVLLGSLLAPIVLGLVGPAYAANGTVLLQLVLVSAVPQIIVCVSMSTARLRHDLRLIIGIYLAQAIGMLGGSWLLIGRWGLAGVGFAALATASLIAVALLLTGRTGLLPDEESATELFSRLLRFGAIRRRRRAHSELRRRLPEAAAAAGLTTTSGNLLTSDCDTLVFAPTETERRLLKIATSDSASSGLDRHADVLDRLSAVADDQGWGDWLPQIRQRVTVADQLMLVESRLPGIAATARGRDPAVTAAALAAVSRLHRATAHLRVVDDVLVRDWIGEPVEQLRRCPTLRRRQVALDRVQATLSAALAERTVCTAGTHGDFWPGNVLITDDAVAGARISGLVDWENARSVGLPDADLLHWWLSTQSGEVGAAVRKALRSPEVAAGEVAATLPQSLPNPQLPIEHVVLLTWLWHVSDGLRRASRNRVGRVWLARNVTPVLRMFSTGTP